MTTRALDERVPRADEWGRYFARHSHSFRFASRFLPGAAGAKVARIYAYCRITDDIVDLPAAAGIRPEDLLGEWVELSADAYQGRTSGLELVDRVMGEMAGAGVRFAYVEELAAGMRMDLHGQRYASMAELRVYTRRVASVVGLWITELFGVYDPQVLEHAARMGHAMQLTNILRDVGDDWRQGRLYLPADLMRWHGVTPARIAAMCHPGTAILASYRALLDEMIDHAEEEHRIAFAWIPCLPSFLQPSVAVAARVYQGIHAAIRRNGYDNLRRRASTSGAVKLLLARRALRDLRRLPRTHGRAGAGVIASPPSRSATPPCARRSARRATA